MLKKGLHRKLYRKTGQSSLFTIADNLKNLKCPITKKVCKDNEQIN